MFESASHGEHPQPYPYERRRPEESVLYRVVEEHWPAFRERMEGLSSLPKFVVREVDEYLRCGVLGHGFVRVQCTDCKFELATIGYCVRSWWYIHSRIATQLSMASETSLWAAKYRERVYWSGDGDSAIRLGVEIEYEVAFRTAKKVLGILEKKGKEEGAAVDDELEIEPSMLACYDIAGRAPKKRIEDGPRLGKGECAVVVDGFNVYAGDGIGWVYLGSDELLARICAICRPREFTWSVSMGYWRRTVHCGMYSRLM